VAAVIQMKKQNHHPTHLQVQVKNAQIALQRAMVLAQTLERSVWGVEVVACAVLQTVKTIAAPQTVTIIILTPKTSVSP